MKKGYYSLLSKIITSKRDSGQYVIERSELEDYIDLSEEDQEEKDRKLKGYMCAEALNSANYRSFAKGQGIYVDVDALNSKALYQHLINNVEGDIKARAAIEYALNKKFEELPDESEYGTQLTCFEPDIIFPELTKQEVLDLIRKLQGDAP